MIGVPANFENAKAFDHFVRERPGGTNQHRQDQRYHGPVEWGDGTKRVVDK